MQANLANLYDSEFQYKAGFMATHEWRPRKFNTAADYLCNISLDEGSDVRHVFVHDIPGYLQDGWATQVYSDRGLRDNIGAAAFAIFLVDVT